MALRRVELEGRPEERLAFGSGGTVDRLGVKCEPATAPAVNPAASGKRSKASRFDLAYAGLLCFTALMIARPQDKLTFLSALHLAELAAVTGLAALVFQRLSSGLSLVRVTPELFAMVAFGGVIAATTPFSIWPGGSVALLTELYLKVLLIFVLLVATVTSVERLKRLLAVILAGTGYIGLLTLTDFARGINLVENGRLAGSVKGIFGNPNDLAMNMVALMPFAMALAARGRTLHRIAAGSAGILMLLTIVLTRSRSGFVGLAAMLVVLLLVGGRIRRGFRAGILALVLASLPFVPSSFWDRMSSIVNPASDETGSREARIVVAGEAWRVFVERPLTGVGAGQFKNYNPPWRQERWREAHNVWLQVASETGVAGLTVFVFLVGSGIAAAARASRRLAALGSDPRKVESLSRADRSVAASLKTLATAAMAGFAGWFACAMFASVAYNWTLYYLLGIAVASRDIAFRLPVSPAAGPRRTGRRPAASGVSRLAHPA